MFLPTIDDYGQQKEKIDINCELLWFGRQVKCLLPQSGVKQTQDLFTVHQDWIFVVDKILNINNGFLYKKKYTVYYITNLRCMIIYKISLYYRPALCIKSTFIHMSNV